MQEQPEVNQLTLRQKQALLMALWDTKKSSLDMQETIFARRMSKLLLRAFVIYKYREQRSPDILYKYYCDFKYRLKECLLLYPDNKQGWKFKRYYPKVPYYLFVLLAEIKNLSSRVECKQILEVETSDEISQSIDYERINKGFLSYYYKAWIALLNWFIDFSGKNFQIVSFKKTLGYISLIPIKIDNEQLIVRGFKINYHDLYHLEVAQLERIQMGKSWVSGIHGINTRVFHDYPIVEEYESFLDEARIAIHEMATRFTAFSFIKALCWMILLSLNGINPLAVTIRHLQSLEKKQQEFID